MADARFLCSIAAVLIVVTKEVLHILSVTVVLLIQHAVRLRHIVICGLFGSAAFSTLSHKWYDFQKDVSEHKTMF